MKTELTFGVWLKRRRGGLGLTQKELAQQVGYAEVTLRKVEADELRPSRQMAERLAEILQIMPEERDLFIRFARDEFDSKEGQAFISILDHSQIPTSSLKTIQSTDIVNHSSHLLTQESIVQPVGIPVMTVSPPLLLPALPPQGMLGQEALLTLLIELLCLDQLDATNIPPVALQGMGGIGKTTLAIALGHLDFVPRLFPDGLLWVTVGPKPTIRNLLEDWGRALGANLMAERDIAGCRDRLRTILHHRRVLLIVDDVWEVSHAEYFLVAGPHCRLLLTTREARVAYTVATRARTLQIDVLQPDAALELLSRLAPEVVIEDVTNTRRLCQRLEFLPLALTLAGRLLANETDVPSRMRRLVSELIERRDARLQLLQVESRFGLDKDYPLSLQTILGMSVERLNQTNQDRFAMLAVFGAEPFTWETEAVAYVWACSIEESEATISEFIQRGLVMRRNERYWMHALLADYVAKMLETINFHQVLLNRSDKNPVAMVVARHREYYLSQVKKNTQDWTRIESIYAQVKQAWALAPEDETLLDFIWALYTYQDLRCLWQDGSEWKKRGLKWAIREGRKEDVYRLLKNLGSSHQQQGELQQAIQAYEHALSICRELGDYLGEGDILLGLGIVYTMQRRLQEAIPMLKTALLIYQELQNRESEAWTATNLSTVYAQLEYWEEATKTLADALKIFRELENHNGEVAVLNNLGLLSQYQGHWNKSIEIFQASLSIAQEKGTRYGEAWIANNLGDIYRQQGYWVEAITVLKKSLHLSRELQDRLGEGKSLERLAKVYADQARWQEAIAFAEISLRIYRESGHHNDESRILSELDNIYHRQKQ